MIKLYENGAYLLNGKELVVYNQDADKIIKSKTGSVPNMEEATKNTMAYSILQAHNTSGDTKKLKIKFDLHHMILHLLELYRQHVQAGLRNFQFLMYLQTAITVFVQLVEQSMKMIICLDYHVQRNMAEYMFHHIRRLFISSQEKCLLQVVR